MGQVDGTSTLNERDWKMIEAIEYYLSIGCQWCYIEKQMNRKRVDLEHLLALGRSQISNKENIMTRREKNA